MSSRDVDYDSVAERLRWSKYGEKGDVPQRAHHLEKVVAQVQRERRKLDALEAKKKNGFKEYREQLAVAKHAASNAERLLLVEDEDGVRVTLWSLKGGK